MSSQGKNVAIAVTYGFAFLVMGCVLAAEGAPRIDLVPGTVPSATDGAQMYKVYCAQCHADSGGGNGPLAGYFTTAPSDLTILSVANSGRFPRQHVMGTLLAGHAKAPEDSPMPVWSAAFRQMDRDNPERALLRARHLVDHVETLQRGPYEIRSAQND